MLLRTRAVTAILSERLTEGGKMASISELAKRILTERVKLKKAQAEKETINQLSSMTDWELQALASNPEPIRQEIRKPIHEIMLDMDAGGIID